MVVPVIWSTGASLSAMEAPDAGVAPGAAILAVCLAAGQAWTRRRG